MSDEGFKATLKQLDERFLKAAAPRAARAVDTVLHRRRETVERVKDSRGLLSDFDLKDLKKLDDRYATRGILGFFREVPQLMAVVIGIVFVAGTLAALNDSDPSSSSEQTIVDGNAPPAPTTSGLGSTILGPSPGNQVSTYLATSAATLATVTAKDAKSTRSALVSFTTYDSPQRAVSLLAGYTVTRVWLRDAGAGKDATQFPLEVTKALGPELKLAFAKAAQTQSTAREQYQKYADTTDADDPYKSFYQGYANLSKAQSKAYAQSCSCVFAAIVLGTPAQLNALAHRAGVRGVEVAIKGLSGRQLEATPLLPEVKGAVPDTPIVQPPS